MIRPPFVNPRTQELRIAAGQSFIFRMVLLEDGLPIDLTGQPFALRVGKRGAPTWEAGRFTGTALADGNIVDVRVPGSSTTEWAGESGLEFSYVKLVRDGMDVYPRGRVTADDVGPLMVAPAGTGGNAPLIVATVDVALATITWESPVSSGASLNAFVTRTAFDAYRTAAETEVTDLRSDMQTELLSLDTRVDALEAGIPAVTLAQLLATGPVAGRMRVVTDVGIGPTVWVATGTTWTPIGMPKLGGAAYQGETGPFVDVVGVETALVTLPIPGPIMGTGRSLVVSATLIHPDSPATKTMRARFSGSANPTLGQIHRQEVVTDASKRATTIYTKITNTAANAQIAPPWDIANSGGSSASLPVPSAVNTASLTYLHLTGLLGDAGRIGVAEWAVELAA